MDECKLERLPRFLDDVDSAFLALRTVWLGYFGDALRNLLLLLAVLIGTGLSPSFRALVIAVISAFICAELLYRACGQPPLRRAAIQSRSVRI